MIKTGKKSKSNGVKVETAAKPEPVKTQPIKAQPIKTPTVSSEPVSAAPSAAAPAPMKFASEKPAATPAPASAAPPVAKPAAASPANHRVALELLKPEAKKVCVAGSFNGWKPERTPLTPAGNGRWVGALSINPGKYEYLFVVDDQWVPDPNAKESVENPFGGRNSILTVSA